VGSQKTGIDTALALSHPFSQATPAIPITRRITRTWTAKLVALEAAPAFVCLIDGINERRFLELLHRGHHLWKWR
jgi:hypothetical protein